MEVPKKGERGIRNWGFLEKCWQKEEFKTGRNVPEWWSCCELLLGALCLIWLLYSQSRRRLWWKLLTPFLCLSVETPVWAHELCGIVLLTAFMSPTPPAAAFWALANDVETRFLCTLLQEGIQSPRLLHFQVSPLVTQLNVACHASMPLCLCTNERVVSWPGVKALTWKRDDLVLTPLLKTDDLSSDCLMVPGEFQTANSAWT